MSKRMRINSYSIKFAFLAGLLFMLSGCASILNPYNENFSCRANPGGRCVSINSAYEESTGDRVARTRPVDQSSENKDSQPPSHQVKPEHGVADSDEALKKYCNNDKDCIAKAVAERARAEAETNYHVASQNKMARMLKEPVTPLVAPPTVLRVLILPYQDEDSGLNLMRYTYIMVDKPKWILGDYLNEGVNVQ